MLLIVSVHSNFYTFFSFQSDIDSWQSPEGLSSDNPQGQNRATCAYQINHTEQHMHIKGCCNFTKNGKIFVQPDNLPQPKTFSLCSLKHRCTKKMGQTVWPLLVMPNHGNDIPLVNMSHEALTNVRQASNRQVRNYLSSFSVPKTQKVFLISSESLPSLGKLLSWVRGHRAHPESHDFVENLWQNGGEQLSAFSRISETTKILD